MGKKFQVKKVFGGITARILLVFVVFQIPVYILMIVSTRSYMKSLEQSAINSAQSILELNMNNLESECDKIDYNFYDLQEYDTNYISLTGWNGNDDDLISLYGVNRSLISLESSYDYENETFVYLKNSDNMLLVTNADSKDISKEEVKGCGLATKNGSWTIVPFGDKQYLSRTSGYNGVYIGTIIDLDSFSGQIKNQLAYQDVMIIVSSQAEFKGITGKVVISKEILSTGHYIHVMLDLNEIGMTMPRFVQYSYYLAIFFLLTMPVVIYLMWKMIVRPVNKIEKGITKLAQGNPDYRIPDFNAAREFVELKNSFNHMTEEIKTLKIEAYEEKLEKEQMLLQNIVLQIGPHFMLNTFNQIFSMAQLKDYEGIQRMVKYLSKFYRYVFCNKCSAPISKEMEVVSDYLQMMELRFMDCFDVTMDMDPELEGIEIPPLIIHNFVENTFKYAVGDGNMVDIDISVKKDGDMAVITISDDGPGIQPDILAKIRSCEPINKSDGMHIGIYNSAYRLKSLYGDKARLEVSSKLTEGTLIRIIVPIGQCAKGDNCLTGIK